MAMDFVCIHKSADSVITVQRKYHSMKRNETQLVLRLGWYGHLMVLYKSKSAIPVA